MDLLLKYGRMSLAIRKPLRAFVATKKNKNAYINDLIAKDAQRGAKRGRDTKTTI